MEQIKPFDAREGKPDMLGDLSPELRAARAEAIKNGTVLEFDKQHGIQNPLAAKEGGTEGRGKWNAGGTPEAAYIKEASALKIRTGDKRDVREIARELMAKASKQEEAA
jgi:hypothetical protein